jgi:Caspase domain
MYRRVLAAVVAVCGLVLLPLSAGPAFAQKRAALVIGNGAYQNVAKLSNPLKDADAITALFQNAGFDWVKMRQDVGNLEFKRALREFMDATQDADIAVVYYAGHGIQVRDMNYMIPVDAKLATEIDAEDEAVSLDRIVTALEPAKRLRLVILDACRDNPFARIMKRRVATRAVSGGLAKMEPTLGDTLIAYAAKAGSTADDGEGQNSPFAAALIKHLAVPGLDIRLAFGRVRDEVLKSTGNKQEPFVYGSLGGDAISLVPLPAKPGAQAVTDVRGDYELVERIGTKKAWDAFLASHKDSLYADLARAQLAKLLQAEAAQAKRERGADQTTPAAVAPTAAPRAGDPSLEERRAWDRIRDSGDRGKLREFVAKYPASPLAETAKNRLDSLDRAAQAREEKARAEREAAQRREEEANRRKAEEAARRTAEGEAARQRDEDARRHRSAEEAERQKAERETAARREEEARLAKAADANRRQQDEACRRDEDRLVWLRASVGQGWAREDLKRLEQDTACDHIRREVVALLAQPPIDAPRQPAAPRPTVANTPELVLAAQRELRRIGCFAGHQDGSLGSATKEAVQRYLSQKGRPANDISVTEDLLSDLKDENQRVCPLSCARGERPEGDRCVANAKPDKTGKAAARQQQPAARSQATAPRPSGVGVGF